MTASNKAANGLLAGVCMLALVCAPSMAMAADAVAPPAGPVSILPEQLLPDGPAAPQGPSVDVGDLAAPGVDRIGLVDTKAGGFSAELWRGTDLDLLNLILPQLPRRQASPTLRQLTRNLLLSPGAPPMAINPSDASAETLTSSQWLLETRAGLLASLGDWAEVQALLDLVPADQMTEGLRRLKTEASLVTNRVSDACAQTQAALNVSPDTYWQKIHVFCQLDINQSSAAGLGLALLREQHLDDSAFFWAVDVLGGGRPPLPETFTRLEPLHFAMLRKAGAVMPANIADLQAKITDPSTLGWLAALPLAEDVVPKGDKTPAIVRRDRRQALEMARIMLTERAVAAGTLQVEMLRTVYRSVNIKDPAQPPLTQLKADDARGRALLFQSALAQTLPTSRAEVIALALDLVRADRGQTGPALTVIGPAYAEMLSQMEPTSDLVWFSGVAARGLIAAGPDDKISSEKAKSWLNLARSMGRRTSREAGQIADSLWPIDRLMMAGPAGPTLPPQAISAFVSALPANTSAEEIAAKQEIVLSVLTAAGELLTAADWLPLMSAPAHTSGAGLSVHLWNGLALAAKDGRAGETAVLALVAMGEDGPAKIDLATLQQVIQSLRLAGREADARALATEALLVFGL
jgi:hypothetical protein